MNTLAILCLGAFFMLIYIILDVTANYDELKENSLIKQYCLIAGTAFSSLAALFAYYLNKTKH